MKQMSLNQFENPLLNNTPYMSTSSHQNTKELSSEEDMLQGILTKEDLEEGTLTQQDSPVILSLVMPTLLERLSNSYVKSGETSSTNSKSEACQVWEVWEVDHMSTGKASLTRRSNSISQNSLGMLLRSKLNPENWMRAEDLPGEHLWLVFTGMVQSGFWCPNGATRNHNQSRLTPDIVGQKPDCLRLVYFSLWTKKDWFCHNPYQPPNFHRFFLDL